MPLLFTAAKTTCEARRRQLTILLAIGWSIAAALLILEVVFDGGFLLQTIRGPWLHDVAALKALKRGGTILLILSWGRCTGPAKSKVSICGDRYSATTRIIFELDRRQRGLGGMAGMAVLVGILVWLLPKTIALWGGVRGSIRPVGDPIRSIKNSYGPYPPYGPHFIARHSPDGDVKFTTDRIFERPLLGWD